MANLKVYIPHRDLAVGRSSYSTPLELLGLDVVVDINEADLVLPLSDGGAMQCAGHPRFMSQESLDILMYRDRLHESGLPTLPTGLIERPGDEPSGTFVKTRHSSLGGVVWQPHLGFPVVDLDISFSVNSASEILVFCVARHQHLEAKKPGWFRSTEQSRFLPEISLIQKAVKRLNIKGGIHNVQFLWDDATERFCVVDWNPRPARVHMEGLSGVYPYLDSVLAFMAGTVMPPSIPAPIFRNEAFWDSPIPMSKDTAIRDIGLIPRYRNTEIVRVSGVSPSQYALDLMFDQLFDLLGVIQS